MIPLTLALPDMAAYLWQILTISVMCLCSTAAPIAHFEDIPGDDKWKNPCMSDIPVRTHGIHTGIHIDVYLWKLQQLSSRLQPLLRDLQDLRKVNLHSLGVQRVLQFQLPGLASPEPLGRKVEKLNSKLLQRWDHDMASAAVYLQLYRSVALRDEPWVNPQLHRALDLVLRGQCLVHVLHAVRFGPRSWPSKHLDIADVVPHRWRNRAPQPVRHLRNFVAARQLESVFKTFEKQFTTLRRAPSL